MPIVRSPSPASTWTPFSSKKRWRIATHRAGRAQPDDLLLGHRAAGDYRGRDGQPLYPQRKIEVGPLVSANTSGGGTHTGKVNGKVIVVANLFDTDAYL
jgi:hypothetical protein